MSDESSPNEPRQPDQPENPAPRPDVPPPSVDAVAAAPPAKPGRGRAVIIVGVIVAFLAIVLFAVRNNVAADDLKVGDCFNIPNGSTIQTVEKHPCTESHNAEVVFVGDYTGANYPISLSLDSFIEEQCVPAFETYLGRPFDADPELAIAYFYPTREGWDNGDKTITCYASLPDESQMTKSLKE